MNATSKQIARSLMLKLAAECEQLRKKEKLTAKELHQLKRLRMLARTVKI